MTEECIIFIVLIPVLPLSARTRTSCLLPTVDLSGAYINRAFFNLVLVNPDFEAGTAAHYADQTGRRIKKVWGDFFEPEPGGTG